MSTVILVLPPPVSANVYWRTRVAGKRAMTYVSSEAKQFKMEAAVAAHHAGLRAPIPGRVRVDLAMYPGRPKDYAKRQRQHGNSWDDSVRSIDLDNAIKVTLDALKGVAFDDDVWVREIVAKRMEPDAHGARLVVRVQSLPVEQPQLALAGEGA